MRSAFYGAVFIVSFSFSPKQIKIRRQNFENFGTGRKHVELYAFLEKRLNFDGLVPNQMRPTRTSLLDFLRVGRITKKIEKIMFEIYS